MLISIAIINDNESLYLDKLFASIGEKWRDKCDFIFADNCSADDSVEAAKKHGIKKIVSPETRSESIAALYNAASEAAEGEYILFTHSDVMLGEYFLERLLRRLLADLPDIINFEVYYADKSTKDHNAIFWNTERQEMYYQQLWAAGPADGYRRLISCSESCFVVRKNLLRTDRFNETYKNNLFVHEFILRQKSQASRDIHQSGLSVEHFFIEKHKHLKSIRYDKSNFVKNNLSVLMLPETGDMFNNREAYIYDLEEKLKNSCLSMKEITGSMQRIQTALPALEKVLQDLESENISAGSSIHVGELCYSLNLSGRAKKIFEKVAASDPGNADALNNLGVIELQKGNVDAARSYFIRALTASPDCSEAKTNLEALSGMTFTKA